MSELDPTIHSLSLVFGWMKDERYKQMERKLWKTKRKLDTWRQSHTRPAKGDIYHLDNRAQPWKHRFGDEHVWICEGKIKGRLHISGLTGNIGVNINPIWTQKYYSKAFQTEYIFNSGEVYENDDEWGNKKGDSIKSYNTADDLHYVNLADSDYEADLYDGEWKYMTDNRKYWKKFYGGLASEQKQPEKSNRVRIYVVLHNGENHVFFPKLSSMTQEIWNGVAQITPDLKFELYHQEKIVPFGFIGELELQGSTFHQILDLDLLLNSGH